MKPVLDRFLHGCTTNPERFEVGMQIRQLLLTGPSKNGISEVLKRCLSHPFGKHALHTLAKLEPKEWEADILWLTSPLPRHNEPEKPTYVIPIFNAWKDLSANTFKMFRRSERDPLYFANRLKIELGLMLPWSFKDMAEGLEAILPLYHPMELVEIFCFGRDAAQPTSINLGLEDFIPSKVQHNTKLKHRYPVSRKIINSRRRRRREADQSSLPNTVEECWIPTPQDLGEAGIDDAAVAQSCLKYLRNAPERGEDHAQFTSHERYLYLFPYAHESLSANKRLEYVGPAQAHAINVLNKLGSYPKADLTFLTKLDRRITRQLSLTNPVVVEREYGLDRPYPDVLDVLHSTLRIILIILFNSGRRARCLFDVKLKHFHVAGAVVDLQIPSTKVGSAAHQRIPLSRLLSERDLEFFLLWLNSRLLDLGLDREIYLFDLLGITRDRKLEPDVARSRLGSLFSQLLGKNGIAVSTHIPRHCFITWFPVRALVAHHPELRNHPLLKDCLDHFWFSIEGLQAMRLLIPSEVTPCTAEIIKIVGHRQPTETRRSYGRSWSLLAALRASLLEPKAFDKLELLKSL